MWAVIAYRAAPVLAKSPLCLYGTVLLHEGSQPVVRVCRWYSKLFEIVIFHNPVLNKLIALLKLFNALIEV